MKDRDELQGSCELQSPEPTYFFFPLAPAGLFEPSAEVKGEAAGADLGFSFFGFLASRFPRCSPLAMICLPDVLHQHTGKGSGSSTLSAHPHSAAPFGRDHDRGWPEDRQLARPRSPAHPPRP